MSDSHPSYKTRAKIENTAAGLTLFEEPAIGLEDTNRSPEETVQKLDDLEELIEQAREEMEASN